MSPGRKHKAASTLRSSHVGQGTNSGSGAEEDAEVLGGKATEDGRESRGSPPARTGAGRDRCAPDDLSRILQSKGFAGGVPLNTERTTVKPWVGI